MLPTVIFIGDDVPFGIDTRADFGEMGGSVIVPPMLVPAHILHAHRLARGGRHDRRRLRGILVA